MLKHLSTDTVVIQKLDMRATPLVFPEYVDVKRICTILQSIEMWLGYSVTVMCNVATPKQWSMAEQLKQVGRDEVVSWEDGKAQSFRPMPHPLCRLSSSNGDPPIMEKHLSSIF